MTDASPGTDGAGEREVCASGISAFEFIQFGRSLEGSSWILRPNHAYWHVPPSMLVQGILNPHVLSLLARVRHTNALVIADRGFPNWPLVETIDLSLIDDVPTVLQVLRAVRGNFVVGEAYMAEEFLRVNGAPVRGAFDEALTGVRRIHEPHVEFKRRIPGAVGLIRTGDTTQYANMLLISA